MNRVCVCEEEEQLATLRALELFDVTHRVSLPVPPVIHSDNPGKPCFSDRSRPPVPDGAARSHTYTHTTASRTAHARWSSPGTIITDVFLTHTRASLGDPQLKWISSLLAVYHYQWSWWWWIITNVSLGKQVTHTQLLYLSFIFVKVPALLFIRCITEWF